MTRNTVMKKLLAVAVMALALYGWSLQGQDGSPGTFPHAPHLEDLTCTDCHATAQEQAKPGYPAADFCAECHDNGMPMPPLDDGTKLEADFSHKAHADLECADCHGDLKAGAVKKPGQKECDSCHAENGVEAPAAPNVTPIRNSNPLIMAGNGSVPMAWRPKAMCCHPMDGTAKPVTPTTVVVPVISKASPAVITAFGGCAATDSRPLWTTNPAPPVTTKAIAYGVTKKQNP